MQVEVEGGDSAQRAEGADEGEGRWIKSATGCGSHTVGERCLEQRLLK